MSEIINIEIKADPSGADEALKQVNKSLKEGKEAAEALNHVLDGDLAGAFKSLGELSKTLGIELDLAFSPAEIIAFVQVVADVADKLSKLIADTFIYTDAQKAEDKAIKASNDSLVVALAHVKALGRETQIAAEKTEAGKEKLRLKFKLEDLGGTPDELRKKLEDVNAQWNLLRKTVEDGPDVDKIATPEGYDQGAAILEDQRLAEAKAKLQSLEAQRTDLVGKIKEGDAEIAASAQATANFVAAQAKATSEAQIEATLRKNEALLGLERAKWDAIKGLVKTGADANEAAETSFENRSYQIQRNALKARLDLAKSDPATSPAQLKTLQGELAALAANHETALTRIKAQGVAARHKIEDLLSAALAKQTSGTLAQAKAENDAIIKGIDQQFQVWDEGYKGQIEVAKIASETKIQLITQDFEKGKITQQQEIALIAKAKQDELALEIHYQQLRQALWDKDPKKVQEIQNQIDKIKAQSELVGAKAQTDSLREQEKNLTQFFSKLKSATDQSISGLLKGTESFSKAWQNMWSDMVVSMVQKLADMMLKWIEHHVAMLVIHTTEKEGELTADASAAAESKGISLADAIAKIHHSAAAAASRVYEAEAPLGPVIAGLLAAGTYTAVLGFGAMASAEGGQYYVPNNQLTMLHPQEMVLPAGIANQMRSVIAGGGGGSGVTVIVNHSVSAVDAASFQGHIRRHSNMIANEVTRALKRKGAR
jgi:hypothetical protein